MSHPFTDIVLPVHNATDYVKNCVRMLYEKTSDFRLIIVDDFSDIATREYLYGPECLGRSSANIYVRTNSQRWFTRAVNIGLKNVRTERAIVLNSDCELGDSWLEQLYEVWDEAAGQHNVGLVGSNNMNDPNRPKWETLREPNYVTGHCWLVSMAALKQAAQTRGTPDLYLNELEAKCIHIFSDNEICYLLNRIGLVTVVSYQSNVGHHGGKSWGHNLSLTWGLKITNSITGEVG